MGSWALLAAWGFYRYTDLLAQVPFARALDWAADKLSGLVQQPWAGGMTGVVIVAAAPAVACGLVMGLSSVLGWFIAVAVVLLCMGPMRLFEMSALGQSGGEVALPSSLTAPRYHALAARDVVGALLWAAILGAPGALFYRAVRELAESPTPSLKSQSELMRNAGVLFGLLYWLPARVYAIAQVASGSGGRLEQLLQFSSDAAVADRLVLAACADEDAAVGRGPKAMLLAALAIAAAVYFI